MVNKENIEQTIMLHRIIIHQVDKVAGESNAVLRQAKQELDITNQERKFVALVNEAYHKKSNPTYGSFGRDDTMFEDLLKVYRQSGEDFYQFSCDVAEKYYLKIKDVAPATGGLLVMAHYISNENRNEYLLVMTTNNKEGFAIDESTLKISGIKNLDFNRIDVGCLINITRWEQINNGKAEGIKTYLSFVKGNKDLSNYFTRFINCTELTEAKESTRSLIKALNAYCKSKDFDKAKIDNVKQGVLAYCRECMDNQVPITLQAVSSRINPDEPDEFVGFASEEQYSVGEVVYGDRSELNKLRKFSYSDKDFSLSFNVNLVDDRIIIDRQHKKVTIKDLPDKFFEKYDN